MNMEKLRCTRKVDLVLNGPPESHFLGLSKNVTFASINPFD